MRISRVRPTSARWLAAGSTAALVLAVAAGGTGVAHAVGGTPSSPVAMPVVDVAGPGSIDQLSVADTDVYGPAQDNMAVASWRTFDGQHWRIAVATYLGSGSWSPPALISPPGVDAEHPSAGVAISEDWSVRATAGSYQQVAWRLTTGEIQLAWRTASDGSWSTPRTVSPAGSATTAPLSLVSYHDERQGFVADGALVWLGRDRARWRVHYLAWPYWATPAGAHLRLLSPSGHDAADVSVAPGRVSWSLFNGTHWQPQTEEVGEYADNTVVTAPTGASEDARNPAAGDDSMVWTSAAQGHERLRASLRPGYGEPLAKPVTVSVPGLDVSEVHLVSSRPHHVEVAWLEGDGSTRRVATSWGDPRTNQWQPPTYLSPVGVDAATLAVDAAGDYGWPMEADATWTQPSGTGHSQVVRALWTRNEGWATPESVSPEDVEAATPFPITMAWGPASTHGVAWVQGPADASTLEVEGYDAVGPNTDETVTHRHPFDPTVLTWSSVDDWSAVVAVQVRTWTTSIGSRGWDTATETLDGTQTSLDVPLAEGTSACWAVRGVDAVGRIGDWPYLDWFRCASAPADDPVFVRSAGWGRVTGDGYFDGSALRATRFGSTLSLGLVRAEDEKVLVATGPGNGTIRMSLSGHHRVVSLASSTRRQRVWVGVASLWDYGAETGTLRVRVISHGRPVWVDGFISERSRWR